jgi:hypothetical protein
MKTYIVQKEVSVHKTIELEVNAESIEEAKVKAENSDRRWTEVVDESIESVQAYQKI